MSGDEFYLSLAIKKAWEYQILTYPNPAVGAVLLDGYGKILSISAHKKAGFLHAEANAILEGLCEISSEFKNNFFRAYNSKFGLNLSSLDELFEPNFTYNFILQNHGFLLKGAKIYVTLEPCSHSGKTGSCARLISVLGIKEVIISQKDDNKIASGGAEILRQNGVNVKLNVLEKEGEDLIKPFLKWQNGSFKFFKLALSANGVASGGIISNLKSRTYSHAIRDVIDILAIGGNSVREDKPRLDSRLVGGRAPDIFIYSKSTNFDKNIPLFSIPKRQILIGDDFSMLENYPLVMVEGGQNLLKKVANQMDMFLIFRSNEFFDRENVRLNLKFRPLYSRDLDGDILSWCEFID